MIMTRLQLLRRTTQGLTLILIIAIPLMNRRGITVLSGTLYSLAVGPLWITDPLSGFQVILTAMSANSVLLLSLLPPIVLALAFGRVFCSWVCPQNTISEILDSITEKVKMRRLFHPSLTSKWRYGILLLLLLLSALLRFPLANLFSAPGIISVQVSKYFYEGTVGPETGLIVFIILAELLLVRRLWCNHICPVGSFLGLFRFKKTMKVAYREDAEHVCGKCLACVEACRLGLDPMGAKVYPFCHNCGDCIAVCEKLKENKKPLSFTF
jgi:ferredoxin-type protein NapH